MSEVADASGRSGGLIPQEEHAPTTPRPRDRRARGPGGSTLFPLFEVHEVVHVERAAPPPDLPVPAALAALLHHRRLHGDAALEQLGVQFQGLRKTCAWEEAGVRSGGPWAVWYVTCLDSSQRGAKQGCIRRKGTSKVVPEAVGQAVGGGCQRGWGQLLSVTNAIEAGTWRWGDSGWAKVGRPGGGGGSLPPSNASLGRC